MISDTDVAKRATITAHQNTWANQRRKRREKVAAKSKNTEMFETVTNGTTGPIEPKSDDVTKKEETYTTSEGTSTLAITGENSSASTTTSEDTSAVIGNGTKRKREEEHPNSKRPRTSEDENVLCEVDSESPLLIAEVVMKKIESEHEDIVLEMQFLSGQSRETMHQVLQYIKNNWKNKV